MTLNMLTAAAMAKKNFFWFFHLGEYEIITGSLAPYRGTQSMSYLVVVSQCVKYCKNQLNNLYGPRIYTYVCMYVCMCVYNIYL